MSDTLKVKQNGQVYTPEFLVQNILDYAGYVSGEILQKHIIDNSCGEGAFLCMIVQRYCTDFLKHSDDRKHLALELSTFVHGIEVDARAHARCIENLHILEQEWKLPPVSWDIQLADALLVKDYDGLMDFVVGNPPYVRVHNLAQSYDLVKNFKFASEGMTDLYLVFFEIGLRMLHSKGRLCYITPSSWLNSLAGAKMRTYLYQQQCLKMVVDLAHFQAFSATTYTMITLLERDLNSSTFTYYVYNPRKLMREKVANLRWEEAFISGMVCLGTPETLYTYSEMIKSNCNHFVSVKNGFATLADKVFIAQEFPFEQFVIPVLKASTGKWYKGFFPYNHQGKPLSADELFASPQLAQYLKTHKDDLLKGKNEEDVPSWYLYGRTQALKDVAVEKIAINTVVKDVASIKLNRVPEGAGLYSGLYILGRVPYEKIQELILSDIFIDYIALLKKYKSGGYYTFSSKDLEIYLNYQLSQQQYTDEQSRVSEGYLQFVS